MRYGQFKLSEDEIQSLRPAVDPNDSQIDNELKSAVLKADTPEEKQNFVAAVKKVTQNLSDKVTDLIKRYGGDTSESIDEDQGLPDIDPQADKKTIFRQAREHVRQQTERLKNANIPPNILAQFKKDAVKDFRVIFTAGQEKEFSDDMSFIEEYDVLVKKLAAKTTGTLLALEAHYEKQAQLAREDIARGDPDSDDYHPGVEIPNVSAPKQTQVEKAVEDTIRSVFSGPAFSAKTRSEKIKTRTTLKKFLGDCVEGILPLGPLLDKGSGNVIRAFEKTQYGELSDFFQELLGKVPSGSGAGSWGPAELALSVVGTPVVKADKGDLNIGGGRMIELKASRSAKSGGRVNTEAIGTGLTGKGNYDRVWKPFAKEIGIGDDRYTEDKKSITFKSQTKKGEVTKKIKYTSWGPTLINNIINPAIESSSVNRGTVVKFVQAVALAPVMESFRKGGGHQFESNRCVNPDGTINDKNFVAEYLNMVMNFYVQTDQVSEVLVINPVTGNYHVIDANKMDTLHNKVTDGDIQLSTTYLDFTDNQSKASPQIGTA